MDALHWIAIPATLTGGVSSNLTFSAKIKVLKVVDNHENCGKVDKSEPLMRPTKGRN